jgi:hypothetical protein
MAAAGHLLGSIQGRMLMKRATRPATRRRQLSPALRGVLHGHTGPMLVPTPLTRGELVGLLQQLRNDIDEFLDGLGACSDPSSNRESSRRA